MPAGRSGRRQIPPQDVARYWQSRAAGMSMKDAAAIAGVHVNTVAKWEAKKRKAQAEIKLAEVEVGQVRKKQGGVQALSLIHI